MVDVFELLTIYQLLKSIPNRKIHGFRSDELDGQFEGSIKSRGLITKKSLSYDVIITYDNRKSNLR